MTVRRLRVGSLPPAGGTVFLVGASLQHAKVLRLRVGDEIVLFDGRGGEARAIVAEARARELRCNADAPQFRPDPGTRLVLMLAVPKGSALDGCVRMATELGVDEIALLYTERTVPTWSADRATGKLERLARIATEAATQCERRVLPMIQTPDSLETWLSKMPPRAVGIVFGARAESSTPHLHPAPEQVWCAIGPEGGFTDSELAAFRDAGFTLASLGNLVLRVETAVVAALSIVQDRLAGP